MAELPDFMCQRCFQFGGFRDHLVDAANFGAVARFHHHADAGAIGDQGGGIRHVAAVGQNRIGW